MSLLPQVWLLSRLFSTWTEFTFLLMLVSVWMVDLEASFFKTCSPHLEFDSIPFFRDWRSRLRQVRKRCKFMIWLWRMSLDSGQASPGRYANLLLSSHQLTKAKTPLAGKLVSLLQTPTASKQLDFPPSRQKSKCASHPWILCAAARGR